MKSKGQGVRIGIAVVIILGMISYLAISGVQANKSYYVTIQELQGLGDKAYTRHLRVAGNVEPGSIERSGTNATFMLVENDKKVKVVLPGRRAAAGYIQGQLPGSCRWHLWPRRRLPRHPATGQMRLEVCSGTGSHSRREAGTAATSDRNRFLQPPAPAAGK